MRFITPMVRPMVRPLVTAMGEGGGGGGQRTPEQIIQSLFAQGQQGFWLPFTDFASLSQDSAGTLPYTALEQPVGRVLDRSGRGNHASQPTSTARGVVSARVNQYLETENIAGAKWTKLNTTASTETSPFENAGVTKLTSQASTAVTGFSFFAVLSGIQRWELSAKAVDGGRYLAFVINQYKEYCFTFDLQNGTITQSPTLGTATAQITAGVDGFWDIVVFQTGNNVQAKWLLSDTPTLNNNTTTFVGDGVKAILVAKPQTSMVLEANRYQRVTTATDYDSIDFPKYLRLDGTDDFYTCPAINSPGGFFFSDVFAPIENTTQTLFSNFISGSGILILRGPSGVVTVWLGGEGGSLSFSSTEKILAGDNKAVQVWADETSLFIQVAGVVKSFSAKYVPSSNGITLYSGGGGGYFRGKVVEPICRIGPPPSAYEREVIRNYQMQKAGML